MADERRLTTRVLVRWKMLARDGRVPSRADLVPEAFGTDCPNCLLVAIEPTVAASRPLYVGKDLGGGGWSPDNPRPLADYPENSLLRLATAKLGAVVAKRAPITFGGTGVHGVAAVLYRAILLPLANDGATIDHVIGAINFKEISVIEEYPDEPALAAAPAQAIDAVSSFIAFSSRRVSFAPRPAAKASQLTIR